MGQDWCPGPPEARRSGSGVGHNGGSQLGETATFKPLESSDLMGLHPAVPESHSDVWPTPLPARVCHHPTMSRSGAGWGWDPANISGMLGGSGRPGHCHHWESAANQAQEGLSCGTATGQGGPPTGQGGPPNPFCTRLVLIAGSVGIAQSILWPRPGGALSGMWDEGNSPAQLTKGS